MGDTKAGPVRVSFNPQLRVEFRGATVTSDAGLLLPRELDERLGLTALLKRYFTDPRTGHNYQFPLQDLLRQSIYSRLAGYEDTNDTERLAEDPTFRMLASRERREASVALTSTQHWFETEVLTEERNYQGLAHLNTDLVQHEATRPRTRRVTLDIDSCENPVHGAQEQSAYVSENLTVAHRQSYRGASKPSIRRHSGKLAWFLRCLRRVRVPLENVESNRPPNEPRGLRPYATPRNYWPSGVSQFRESHCPGSVGLVTGRKSGNPGAMPLKLGIIANEFFDLNLGPGRMGGFGWAARQVSGIFADPSLDTTIVYFTGELIGSPPGAQTIVHGRPLILRQPTVRADFLRARSESPDLVLMVDFRPTYRWIFHALPTTPVIVWVRDPRPPDDVAKVASLRIPGAGDELPLSALQPDCSSLGSIAHDSRRRRRPLFFASPAPHLRRKLEAMIGMGVDSFDLLPNPIDLGAGGVPKSPHPRVAFLARLDPYKRPWLAVELARRFRDVEFLLAGKAHYHGPGAWRPADLPSNVRLLGHVNDRDKVHLLASSWVLLNTSIHEGLAVSFLEALACGTPLLATVDPGGVVSRYGIFAGRFDGTGLAALPALEAGLRRLLAQPLLRDILGARGSAWVSSTHSRRRFLEALTTLVRRAGLPPPPALWSDTRKEIDAVAGGL